MGCQWEQKLSPLNPDLILTNFRNGKTAHIQELHEGRSKSFIKDYMLHAAGVLNVN